jgi:hypothetical protein
MHLRNGIRPCRTERSQQEPGLHELPSLDPIGLHTCPTTWLAGLGISPFERKAKPGAVAFERMIVNDHPYIGPLLIISTHTHCNFLSINLTSME